MHQSRFHHLRRVSLDVARAVVADITEHSDARIRRACLTIATYSDDPKEVQEAKDLRAYLCAQEVDA